MEQERTWRWTGLGILVLVLIFIAYAVIAGTGSRPPVNSTGAGTTSTTTAETAAATSSGVSAGQSAPTRTGKAPAVKTIGFAAVSSTTALVIGTVSPEGAATTYWFEYGTSLNFGSVIDARSAGAGVAEVGAAGDLSNLKPGTEYYFRIGAQNAYGRSYGAPYKLITATK